MVDVKQYMFMWLKVHHIKPIDCESNLSGHNMHLGAIFDEVLEKSKFECKYQSKVLQICWFECEYACVDSKSIIHFNLCVVLEYSTKQFFDADNKSHLFVQNGGKI